MLLLLLGCPGRVGARLVLPSCMLMWARCVSNTRLTPALAAAAAAAAGWWWWPWGWHWGRHWVLWLWVLWCILWLLHVLAHHGMLLLLLVVIIGLCVRLPHVLLLMMLWRPRRGAWLMHLLIPWHTISCLHHAAMAIARGITWLLLAIGVFCRKSRQQQRQEGQ